MGWQGNMFFLYSCRFAMLLSELLAIPGWPFLTFDFDNKGYSIETLWNLVALNLNLTLKSFCWWKVLQLIWSYQVQITVFPLPPPPKKNTDLLFVSETHQPPVKENRRKPSRLGGRLQPVSRLQCSQLMRRPCCSRMHYKSRRIKFTGLREKVGRKRWCVFFNVFFPRNKKLYTNHRRSNTNGLQIPIKWRCMRCSFDF